MAAVSVARHQLVIANVDGTLLAYRDVCAECGGELHDGELVGGRAGVPELPALVLPAPRGTLDGRRSAPAGAGPAAARAGSRQGGAGAMNGNGNGSGRAERRLVADAVAARRRAQLVSGLRGLASAPSRGRRAGDRQAGDRRPDGETLRSVRRRDRRGSPPSAAPERAPDRVRVRGMLGDALGRGRLPADRLPNGVAARPRPSGRPVGELSDPDRAGVLHALDGDRVRRRDVPEPGGSDRERAALRDVGADGGAQPACWRTWSPTSRA